MVKNSSSQNGGAFVVIIVILTVAIVGALGFIFWQNFVNTEQDSTAKQQLVAQKQVEESVSEKNNTYTQEDYSFDYPAEGWNLVKIPSEGREDYITLQTSDYKNLAMAIESGAIIEIAEPNAYGLSMQEEMVRAKEFAGSQDVEETTVSGMPAFTYSSGYEGLRYHTVIYVNDKLAYDIVYRFEDNGDVNEHQKAYNLVTSTFRIRN